MGKASFTFPLITPSGNHLWTPKVGGSSVVMLCEQSDFGLFALRWAWEQEVTIGGFLISNELAAAAESVLHDRYPYNASYNHMMQAFTVIMAKSSSVTATPLPAVSQR